MGKTDGPSRSATRDGDRLCERIYSSPSLFDPDNVGPLAPPAETKGSGCGGNGKSTLGKSNSTHAESSHLPFGCGEDVGIYQEARFVRRTFGVVEDIRLFRAPSALWTRCTHSFGWRHCSNIYDALMRTLVDLRADSGIDAPFWMPSSTRDMFRPRYDLLVPLLVVPNNDHLSDPNDNVGPSTDRKHREPIHVPLGAFLLRPTGRAHLKGGALHGQMYDHLMMLRAYHGLAHPLGVVTNYQYWRLVWLPDSDPCAQSVLLSDPCFRAAARPKPGAAGRQDDNDDSKRTEHVWVLDEPSRVLHGTGLYAFRDPRLVPTLATLLHKMALLAPQSKPTGALSLASKGPVARVSERGWEWVRCNFPPRWGEPDGHRTREMPDAEADAFFLIEELGAGADGTAWRACDVHGRPCVIKWGHQANDDEPGDESDVANTGEALWRESVLWRTVWGVDRVRTLRLADRPALLMPYAETLPNADAIDVAVDNNGEHSAVPPALVGEVLGAIHQMAALGLCHDDLRWRHVGRIHTATRPATSHPCDRTTAGDAPTDTQQGRVVFFDLVRMRRMAPGAAVRHMRARLGVAQTL